MEPYSGGEFDRIAWHRWRALAGVGYQHLLQGLGGGRQLVLAQADQADPPLYPRAFQGHAAGTQLTHLPYAQGRYRTDPEAVGDHPPDGAQLMAFESHRQLAVLGEDGLFEQQAHRRGALQGNEVFG